MAEVNQNNTTALTETKAVDPYETIKSSTYANIPAAMEALGNYLEKFPELAEAVPFLGLATDDEGDVFLPDEIYSDDVQIGFKVHRTYKDNGVKLEIPRIVAIAFYPVPTLESAMADSNGLNFVRAMFEQAIQNIAMRPLSTALVAAKGGAFDPAAVAEKMPKTLAEYISSQRDAPSAYAAYDAYQETLLTLLAKSLPALKSQDLKKKKLRLACESVAYAKAHFVKLEEAKGGSFFELFINLLIKLADKNNMDSKPYHNWLATRATATMTEIETDIGAIDIDSFAASLMSSPDEASNGEAGEESIEDEGEPTES